jgi:hypothetical protein
VAERTSSNNLEQLWEVRDSIPRERRDDFTNIFIGALSVEVSPAVWDQALRVAKVTVEANRG